MNPREIAYKALLRVETDKAYSNITIDNLLSEHDLKNSDKAFASAIFYGVLERKITLDYIISKFSKIKPEKMDTSTLTILRQAVYQLLYMDKVPSFAAVDEALKLARKEKLFRATGFINAVLRAISKDGSNVELPKVGTDLYYCVKYSCPKQIVRLFRTTYGDMLTEKLLASFMGRPPLTVRVNTLKTDIDSFIKALDDSNIEHNKTQKLANCLDLLPTTNIFSSLLFKEGYFHVQDAASQICCEILAPKAGESILDVCAAPGGKTATMAELMNNKGSILACDLYDHKLNLINDTAKRLGIDIITTLKRDALSEDNFNEFDRVLCDVPCSGLGILRRKPEIRYKSDLGLDTLPELQYKILCNSARFVKKGGTLLYSTCTLNKKENIHNAERFLNEHPEFEPKSISLPHGIERTIDEPDYSLTLFPYTCNTDGFFISTFTRRK